MTSVDAAPRLLSDINFDQCLCGLERYDMRITHVISGLDYSPSDMQVTSWRNEMARAGWRRPSKRPRCGVGLARVVKSLNPLAFHNGKAQNSDWSAGNEGFPFMRNPYRVVLKLVRFVRRVHRGIRKHLPAWGFETLEALEYANFFKLGITLAAISFVPEHYFKTFSSTASGKSKLFMSPFKILTSFASACAILFGWMGLRLKNSMIITVTIIAGLSAPIWIYFFLGFVWYVRKVLGAIGQFNRLLDFFFEPFWFEAETKMLWSLQTFRRLNYGLYFPGINYLCRLCVRDFSFCAISIACLRHDSHESASRG
jgi:hypothetical protein